LIGFCFFTFTKKNVKVIHSLIFRNLFSGVTKKLKSLFEKKIDQKSLEELEDILISSDVGLPTTEFLINQIKNIPNNTELSLKDVLKEEMLKILKNSQKNKKLDLSSKFKPTVLFIVGVNGVGKTVNYFLK
jgi:fused signal recognition particle receptor